MGTPTGIAQAPPPQEQGQAWAEHCFERSHLNRPGSNKRMLFQFFSNKTTEQIFPIKAENL